MMAQLPQIKQASDAGDASAPDAPAREKRLFFALWPSASVVEALLKVAESLTPQGPARPIQPAALHITLAFLGNVPAARVPLLIDLARSLSFPALSFNLDEVGGWRGPRVVWAGSHTPPAPLIDFATQLQAKLRESGFPIDARPFVPHVTLLRNAIGVKAHAIPPIEWQASSFQLIESQQGARGSVYVPLWESIDPSPAPVVAIEK